MFQNQNDICNAKIYVTIVIERVREIEDLRTVYFRLDDKIIFHVFYLLCIFGPHKPYPSTEAGSSKGQVCRPHDVTSTRLERNLQM